MCRFSNLCKFSRGTDFTQVILFGLHAYVYMQLFACTNRFAQANWRRLHERVDGLQDPLDAKTSCNAASLRMFCLRTRETKCVTSFSRESGTETGPT